MKIKFNSSPQEKNYTETWIKKLLFSELLQVCHEAKRDQHEFYSDHEKL
jgi:hypothetical protein